MDFFHTPGKGGGIEDLNPRKVQFSQQPGGCQDHAWRCSGSQVTFSVTDWGPNRVKLIYEP